MTTQPASSNGGSVPLKKPLRRAEAAEVTVVDGYVAAKQGLVSKEDARDPNVVQWASKIWDDEVVELIEARIVAENENTSIRKEFRWCGTRFSKEEWERAYFLRFAVSNLERLFEDEGLRPAFAEIGGIPLPVAERWLLRGLGITRNEFLVHVFDGKRPKNSLLHESDEAMRFLCEIIQFTPKQWDRISTQFFPAEWEVDFNSDEYSMHYGMRLRRHFLSNRNIPSELFQRLLHEVVEAPLLDKEPFSSALGWMLSNAAFSTENLEKVIGDIRVAEERVNIKHEDSQVEWELICTHPNWTPMIGELLSFHDTLSCGRRTRHPYSGCNLLKDSPCRERQGSYSTSTDRFYMVESFINFADFRMDSSEASRVTRNFILCPHEHEWGELTKKAAMASLEAVESPILMNPKAFAAMMPGYGLGRLLLKETAAQFENGDNIPVGWLKELI